eukprot:scaffold67300_cov67-Phaeocystis_antarctica.AAC.3
MPVSLSASRRWPPPLTKAAPDEGEERATLDSKTDPFFAVRSRPGAALPPLKALNRRPAQFALPRSPPGAIACRLL